MSLETWVKDAVRMRSKYSCEICDFYCPWIIQFHHVKPVSKGGDDYPDNIAHICPNCHAIIHAVNAGSKNDEKRLYGLMIWVEKTMNTQVALLMNEFICFVPVLADGKWEIKSHDVV